MTAKFDDGQIAEQTILIHDKMTVNKHEKVAFHKQKIRAILDGQKPCTRNIDSVCVLEVLDSRSCCRFKLLIFNKRFS